MSLFERGHAEQRLDSLAVALEGYYESLNNLAETIWRETPPPAEGSLDLDDLEQRLVWDTIRGYVLAARHEIHGGLTTIVKARGRAPYWRPHGDPGDPSAGHPSDAEYSSEERARAHD